MKYTHEIVGTHGGAKLPERAPGAYSGSKTLVCSGLYKAVQSDFQMITDITIYSQLSLLSGHCRDLELVYSLARVRNSGSLYQSNVFNLC